MWRIAVVMMFLNLPACAQTTFDLSADFSLQENPHKEWQYGYSATNSLASDQLQFDKHADATGAIGFWHPAASEGPGPGWYPYIAYKTTKQTQYGSSNGWAARAGEVAMEASNSGQYSLVRFVAPSASTYKISAKFEGIHFGLSTTDVHVLHNDKPLLTLTSTATGEAPRSTRCRKPTRRRSIPHKSK